MIDPHATGTRSVTWNKQQPITAMSSAAILKAISNFGTTGQIKSKSGRRSSKAAQKWSPKLVFEYGPTSYRGLMLHRKIKIAPFAEYFQKKYPDLRVYYHPVIEYNRVTVKLMISIICKYNMANLGFTKFANITSQAFFKEVDKAVKRVLEQPNLMTKPFRDPMCLMTHNLDIDYDYPWYRTQFQTYSNIQEEQKYSRLQVSFDRPEPIDLVGYHCQVQWDTSETSSKLWDKFKKNVESSPDFESMLANEAPKLKIGKRISKKKPRTS
uniref:Polypeptide N-acetylgalactosaminyltransferase 1 n=1 Tax=Lygus hesperus TaxID=30085 RepID=A0A0A9Z4I2_LYGHE